MELIQENNYDHQLTDESKNIIDELHKFNQKYLKLQPNIGNNTTEFFKDMYDDIIAAKRNFKKKYKQQFSLHEITSTKQIPKPDTFHAHFFPSEIIKLIDSNSTHYLRYDYKIDKRTININLIFMDHDKTSVDSYNHYIEIIYMITHILNNYSSIECGKNLSLYIYLTDFKKNIPNSNLEEFDTEHVNTAYSDICTTNSQIVIYRKEEWIKVLIHELFHNYGLDFSKIKYGNLKDKFKELFPIKSDFEITESYAEFFGEMINVAITTFYLDDSTSIYMYIKNAHYLLFYEQLFSMFQCVKILYKIGLGYENLYLQDDLSKSLRNNIYYRENTNVFCYYVVKNILLFNCDDFVGFCYDKNLQFLDFRKTDTTLNFFYDFVKSRYNDKKLLNVIHKTEKNINNISNKLLKNTARISCIELN
jgi:hypothetical protein